MNIPNEIKEISVQVGDWDESVGLRPNFLTIKENNGSYIFDFENKDSQEYRKLEIEEKREILANSLAAILHEDIIIKYDFEIKAELDADMENYENKTQRKI